MKAFVTASLDAPGLARLGRMMELHVEDWKDTGRIFFDGAEFAGRIREEGCNVAIVEADMIQREVFDAVELSMVGVCRGDPVNVDVGAATERGVPVFHTPGRNAEAVADLTLCFLLMLARNVWAAISFVKGQSEKIDNAEDYLAMYRSMTGIELSDRRVGIVGFGAIGRRVAERVRVCGAKVLAFDPFVDAETCAAHGAEKMDLDPLLAASDFLTLHVPDVPATKGLLGAREIGLIKEGAYFVNTGRAGSVEEDPLYEACASGRIRAAAFDVFWKEPVRPDDRFVRLPNVIATPHIGGASHDVARHQSTMICDGIEAWIEGRRPPFLFNPEVFKARGPARSG